MTDAKRGRGSRRGIHLCAVAALGFALSACGGGGGPTGAAATSQAATGVASNASTNTNTNPAPPTASSGAVTINWTPPTENTDGTPLTNLAGYDIHYGTASGDYTQNVSVSNPGLATYVVDNLGPGTYYFSIAAVNSAGAESPLSPEVSMTVN